MGSFVIRRENSVEIMVQFHNQDMVNLLTIYESKD